MLEQEQIPYRYREYRKEPLSASEIRSVLKKLGVRPAEVLRPRDAAYRELGLSGSESDDRLIELMAEHPTLLQRPIGVKGKSCLLYTSPSPRDATLSRMPSSA